MANRGAAKELNPEDYSEQSGEENSEERYALPDIITKIYNGASDGQEDADELPRPAPLVVAADEDAPPTIREQLAVLRQRPPRPMDLPLRRRAMTDVVAQLEKRSLRRLKEEEQIRFAESPPDLDSEELQEILAVNRRIKHAETLSRSRP